MPAAAQLAEGGLLSGLLGDFCHSFQTISLYWLCFKPGFSSFSSGSMASEKEANAAFIRLVGTALISDTAAGLALSPALLHTRH